MNSRSVATYNRAGNDVQDHVLNIQRRCAISRTAADAPSVNPRQWLIDEQAWRKILPRSIRVLRLDRVYLVLEIKPGERENIAIQDVRIRCAESKERS